MKKTLSIILCAMLFVVNPLFAKQTSSPSKSSVPQQTHNINTQNQSNSLYNRGGTRQVEQPAQQHAPQQQAQPSQAQAVNSAKPAQPVTPPQQSSSMGFAGTMAAAAGGAIAGNMIYNALSGDKNQSEQHESSVFATILSIIVLIAIFVGIFMFVRFIVRSIIKLATQR